MKNYCAKCKKILPQDIEQCDRCGGKFFIFGEKFHIVGEKIICDCGNTDFKNKMHIDYFNKAMNNYACSECGNIIGTELYRYLFS